MAINSAFFNAMEVDGKYDRTYFAEDFARYFASFIGNGIFPNPSTNFQVFSPATPGFTVQVQPGDAWINGYYAWVDTVQTLSLSLASGTYDRIDAIVLRWSNLDRTITLEVVSGEPSYFPVKPEPQRDADIYELVLAYVTVNRNVSTITQADIEDTRWNSTLCGIVHGVVDQIDSETIGIQLTAIINQFRVESQQQYDDFVAELTEKLDAYTKEFEDWFETIRDLFDEETLGRIINMVEANTARIEAMEAILGQGSEAGVMLLGDVDQTALGTKSFTELRLNSRHVILGANASGLTGVETPSVAIGGFAAATANNTIAIGAGITAATGAKASGANSVAIGTSTNAAGAGQVVIGNLCSSTAASSVAVGQSATISGGSYGVSIGATAEVSQNYGISIGYGSRATAVGSIAMGYNGRASGTYSLSMHVNSSASGSDSVAIGRYSSAAGISSIAIGGFSNSTLPTTASGGYSIALGRGAKANSNYVVSIGDLSETTVAQGVSIGFSSSCAGLVAVGAGSKAVGTSSIAIGGSTANSAESIAIGAASIAGASGGTALSIAIGGTATGVSATTVGGIANGLNSTAIGVGANTASQTYSTAIGAFSSVSGNSSVVIGYQASAAGYSVVIGRNAGSSAAQTVAIGAYANAVTNAIAIGPGIGTSSRTQATGQSSIAIGYGTTCASDTTIGIGLIAVCRSQGTISLGYQATSGTTSTDTSLNRYGIAIGFMANAFAEDSIVIGRTAKVNDAENVRAIVIGKEAYSGGIGSIVIGSHPEGSLSPTQAASHGCTVIGPSTQALGYGSVVIGSVSNPSNIQSVGARSSGRNECVVGPSCVTAASTGYNNVAMGTACGVTQESDGGPCVAMGVQCTVAGSGSSAFGTTSSVDGNGCVAIGSAVAFGSACTSVGVGAWAGDSNSRNNDRCTVVGGNSGAYGTQITVIGAGASSRVNSTVNSTLIAHQYTYTTSNAMRFGNDAVTLIQGRVNFTAASDERDKADFEPVDKALEFVNKLKPVRYVLNPRQNYVDFDNLSNSEREQWQEYGFAPYDKEAHAAGKEKGERKRVGFSAQHTQKVLQEVYGDDNYMDIVHNDQYDRLAAGETLPEGVEEQLSMTYTNVIPALVGAIQELTQRVKELEAKYEN